MTILKAGGLIAAALGLLAAGLASLAWRDGGNAASRSTARAAGPPVPAFASSRDATAVLLAARATSAPTTGPSKRRNMLDWQRALYDSQTTASAFAQAVDAAETGDLGALREIHDLLVTCQPVMQYVREGGEREKWMSGQLTPPNGIRWFEPFYDRCAAIANASAFATLPADAGKLTAAYWTQLAVGFDDPLFKSFAIAEYAGHAQAREYIATELNEVLRSADMTAWRDLGGRLFDLGLTADKAVGVALIQVACARGYDCTRAATDARSQALFEELTLLLDQQDWEAIERLVPLDGVAFSKQE